jgi:hypothetical protein
MATLPAIPAALAAGMPSMAVSMRLTKKLATLATRRESAPCAARASRPAM